MGSARGSAPAIGSAAIRSPLTTEEPTTQAAYGLRLTGIEEDGSLAVHGGTTLPAVPVARVVEPVEQDDRNHIRVTYASFAVGRSRVHVTRKPATASIRSPARLEDDEVVHPCLSRVGGMFGLWLGREVLHGGAFTVDGAAWLVLGASEAGKSTLLAELAGAGYEVLADDMLVIEDGLVFAGPRCVDLRPDAAAAIGALDARPCRGGLRRRLRLPPALAAAPVAGVIHLTVGHRLRLDRVEAARRIGLLQAATWLGPLDSIDKRTLLDLAGLPTLELVRPSRFGKAGSAVAALSAALGG